MSLSDLASLGSFVSGAAVLASLVFLFFQMRQMTEQVRLAENGQRALMQQGRSSRASAYLGQLSAPHASDVWAKGLFSLDDLGSGDAMSLVVLINAQLLNVEDSFLQRRSGTLDAISFETDENLMRAMAQHAGYRAAWQMLRGLFNAEFREFVDEIIKATGVLVPSDIGQVFSEIKRAELAKAEPVG